VGGVLYLISKAITIALFSSLPDWLCLAP
jgi:hypothetical protein